MKPPNLLFWVDRYMSAWVLLMEVGEQYIGGWAKCSVCNLLQPFPLLLSCAPGFSESGASAGCWGAN